LGGTASGRVVGFDIDGTITEDNLPGNIWDVEVSRFFGVGRQTDSYSFCDAYGLTMAQVDEFCAARLDGIFRTVPLKAGAATAIATLRAAGAAVHLVTARPPEHAGVTEEYLGRHGIGHDGLWFEPDKVSACRRLGISFFADDRAETCQALAESGVRCLLVDAFHNHEVSYDPRVSTWGEILRYAQIHLSGSPTSLPHRP
jgi:uncharacterized HAD superfamily protein